VDVAAPTAASLTSFHSLSATAAASASQAQPLSVQLSVVEFSLSLLGSLLATAQKAHVASRRLTNRAQPLSEGRHQSSEAALDVESPLDSYAPFAFRPLFLHALSTLQTSSPSFGAKLSPQARKQLAQIVLLSSPTPVVPSALQSAAAVSAVAVAPPPMQITAVADSDSDVIHYFFTLQSLSESVLARAEEAPDTVHSFLRWTDALLAAHPRVAAAWCDSVQPHVFLSRTMLAFYGPLASASTASASKDSTAVAAAAGARQAALLHLNSVLARVLGLRAGQVATGAFIDALLKGQIHMTRNTQTHTAFLSL
jgi:hypothetical protein